MPVLLQVLPLVGLLVVVVGGLVLAQWWIARGRVVRRPREDAALQPHQQTARSQIGGGGFGP